MSRRLAITPTQLQRFLEILTPFGFTAARVEVTSEGAVILHAEGAEKSADPLLQWEARRAAQSSH